MGLIKLNRSNRRYTLYRLVRICEGGEIIVAENNFAAVMHGLWVMRGAQKVGRVPAEWRWRVDPSTEHQGSRRVQ